MDVTEISRRHGFGEAAGVVALKALIAGGGRNAQFDHPELGGRGQWMPGMIMIGDMFNNSLKAKVAALFTELAGQIQAQGNRHDAAVSLKYGSVGGVKQWYPADLGDPSTSGEQNDVRYAFFPAAARLAIELQGRVTLYDSSDHDIYGVSQQQDHAGGKLVFVSQHGVVSVDSLRVVAQ